MIKRTGSRLPNCHHHILRNLPRSHFISLAPNCGKHVVKFDLHVDREVEERIMRMIARGHLGPEREAKPVSVDALTPPFAQEE
jgi:hypothetical protein